MSQQPVSQSAQEAQPMRRTPLYDAHVRLGARMVPFAGFDMPLQYSSIVAEHRAVRTAAGVFDVSHMGEIALEGPSAEAFLDSLFTGNVRALPTGKVAYGMFCQEDGGTVDDLLVYRLGAERFLLVVNAACTQKDFAWIAARGIPPQCSVRDVSLEWAQLALQGPLAEDIAVRRLGIAEAASLGFYAFCFVRWEGKPMLLSRTGYTGEDGFECYAAPEVIQALWERLMQAGVTPCGLGCRDTLRFEAGLPLYGHELSDEISPVMAGLSLFCDFGKPFIGREALLAQRQGGLRRKLVGLALEDRAVPRAGYAVTLPGGEGASVGVVTTGYHAISLDQSLCFALVDVALAAEGTPLEVRIRDKAFPATVRGKRFYKARYKK